MSKWQLVSPYNEGAKTYTFGKFTFTADADGVFEVDKLPEDPIYAIARRVDRPRRFENA